MKNASAGHKTGFTLIELLVVVLIIGILASVALPAYERSVWKSRSVPLQIWAKKVLEAEEVYYMSTGRFTQCLDRLDLDYAVAFPKVTKQDSGWYDGGVWADNCVREVQSGDEFPGITLSAEYNFIKAVFSTGKYTKNGFGVYLSLPETEREVGGLWGTCGSMGDNVGWKKILTSMGYTKEVVNNYACYQQLNQP